MHWERRRYSFVLVEDDSVKYTVDLDRVTSQEDAEDWVRHIAGKPWARHTANELNVLLTEYVKRNEGFSRIVKRLKAKGKGVNNAV